MRKVIPFLGGILLGVGVGIVIFFGLLREDTVPYASDLTPGSERVPIPSLNAPAPGFQLDGISGEPIHLEDFRGKPVLLNFWATWCAPCRLEMPTFQSYSKEYTGNLVVIAVNNAEDPKDVRAFIDDFDLTFDVLLDPDSEVQRLYQVLGYPTTFLIDSDGVIRVRHIGLMTEDQLDGYLKELGVGK